MERSILEQIIRYDFSTKAAICTQVEWKGSVPRKDYPMMLVDKNRNIIGTIGGGALENSTIEIAQVVIKASNPVVKSFDLTNQDVSKEESICGGTTTILIEPFTKKIQNFIKNGINEKILQIIIDTKSLNIERKLFPNIDAISLPPQALSILEHVERERNSKSVYIKDQYYLYQYFSRAPVLHIFGAGHVGQAVAFLAHFVSLDTIIYDERIDLNNSERFPYAKEHIIKNIAELINNLITDEIDFILVATRGHKNDFILMQKLLQMEFSYISLVSSNKKWELLAEALIKDGIPQDKIDLVHSPVGLDIGSETVPEIAISIISEIINHYRKESKSQLSLSTK